MKLDAGSIFCRLLELAAEAWHNRNKDRDVPGETHATSGKLDVSVRQPAYYGHMINARAPAAKVWVESRSGETSTAQYAISAAVLALILGRAIGGDPDTSSTLSTRPGLGGHAIDSTLNLFPSTETTPAACRVHRMIAVFATSVHHVPR